MDEQQFMHLTWKLLLRNAFSSELLTRAGHQNKQQQYYAFPCLTILSVAQTTILRGEYFGPVAGRLI